MAPLTPFITERVWQDLVVPVTPGAPESVHLASWPEADLSAIDPELSKQMVLVRRLVELGRATRAESGVKTRQPLSRALIAATGFDTLDPELHAQITEELNVSSLASLSEVGGSLVDTTAKANFRALGKRFGKRVQDVAKAVAERRRGRAVAGAARGHGVGRGRRRDDHPRSRTRSSSRRPRARAGRWPPTRVPRSPWTWRSPRSCARRASPVTRSA